LGGGGPTSGCSREGFQPQKEKAPYECFKSMVNFINILKYAEVVHVQFMVICALK